MQLLMTISASKISQAGPDVHLLVRCNHCNGPWHPCRLVPEGIYVESACPQMLSSLCACAQFKLNGYLGLAGWNITLWLLLCWSTLRDSQILRVETHRSVATSCRSGTDQTFQKSLGRAKNVEKYYPTGLTYVK